MSVVLIMDQLIDQIEELETKLSAANDTIADLRRELADYELKEESENDY